MPDVDFRNYAYTALDAPTVSSSAGTRTTARRLAETCVNVKDHGAKGDGVTDDSAAIRAAITYAYTHYSGASSSFTAVTFFFPPGTYIIGSPPLLLDPVAGVSSKFIFAGAGRDVSILKGSISSPVTSPANYQAFLCIGIKQLRMIRDLTIWNTSEAPRSGALQYLQGELALDNCHLIGHIGYSHSISNFGGRVSNCKFTCSTLPTAANATTRNPLFSYDRFLGPSGGVTMQTGSVGISVGQSEVTNCTAYGFDIGFAVHTYTLMSGCHAVRCGAGLMLSVWLEATAAVEVPTLGQLAGSGQTSYLSNRFERCQIGALIHSLGSAIFAANTFEGSEGPWDPVTISNMTWAGGVATVTSTAHGLAVNDQIYLRSSNAAWLPTNAVALVATVPDADHFTYSLAASPGAFGTASWNRTPEYSMMNYQLSEGVLFASNSFLDFPGVLNVGRQGFSSFTNGIQRKVVNWAMRGTWGPVQGASSASWEFEMVSPSSGTLPLTIAAWGQLPGQGVAGGGGAWQSGPMVGQESIVTGANAAATWGAAATTTGASRYKVRYDGTNWIRIA